VFPHTPQMPYSARPMRMIKAVSWHIVSI